MSDVRASDVGICAEAQRGHFVLQGAQVGADFVLQSMVTVAIGQRELKTAVLQRGSIHSHCCVGHTGTGRHGNAVEQLLRLVLIPLGGKLDAIIEESQVETDVVSLSLFPRELFVCEVGDSRTRDRLVAKRIGHVVACHGSLDGIVGH